jgi:hypothetical protein
VATVPRNVELGPYLQLGTLMHVKGRIESVQRLRRLEMQLTFTSASKVRVITCTHHQKSLPRALMNYSVPGGLLQRFKTGRTVPPDHLHQTRVCAVDFGDAQLGSTWGFKGIMMIVVRVG